MSTGTALVNARTPKAVPDEQFQGSYVFTPPEVQAYLRGEQLNEADLGLVKTYYGGNLPILGHTITPQSPEDYPAAAVKAALAGQPVKPTQRRLVAKRLAGTDVNPPETILLDFLHSYLVAVDETTAWNILLTLAKRFEMEIE